MLRARTSMAASSDSAIANDMKDTSLSFDAESGNLNKYNSMMNGIGGSSSSSLSGSSSSSSLPSWANNNNNNNISSSRMDNTPNIQVRYSMHYILSFVLFYVCIISSICIEYE